MQRRRKRIDTALRHALPQKPLVIVTEHLSEDAAHWLAARTHAIHCPVGSDTFETNIARAAGLVIRTYTMIDQALLDRAPKLRVIARAGVGLDNVDVSACRDRGIEVVYTPDANTQSVVEFIWCILGDILRPRLQLDHSIDAATWNSLREKTVGVRQFNEHKLGILGMGRVGKRLALAAQGLNVPTTYSDLIHIAPDQRANALPVDAHTLFATSDIVSVHIDGRPSNRKFINAALIDLMKPDAIFINTSRGLVVDNLPLTQWLQRNPDATALLDVHDPEPIPPDYPLLHLPNARLYPHLASRTKKAMDNMSWVVRDVVGVLEGRKPEFPAPLVADCS